MKPISNRRILVVDDDEAIRNLLTAVFRKRGFEVDAANDGREAVASLRDGNLYDLILLDLMMPNMDGPGFLTSVQSLELEQWPMILLITAAHDHDFPKVDSQLITAIVRKPFDIFQLAELVEESLRRDEHIHPPSRTVELIPDAPHRIPLRAPESPGTSTLSPAEASPRDDPPTVEKKK